MLLKISESMLFKRVETILLKSIVAIRPVLVLECILCVSIRFKTVVSVHLKSLVETIRFICICIVSTLFVQ